MSSLSLNTIGLFLALAPGFFFLIAFYLAGSIPRRALRSSGTVELAVLATLSLFAHLLLGGFYAVVVAPALFEVSVLREVLDLVLARAPEPPLAVTGASPAPGVQPAYMLVITGYAVFVCGLSALIGAALINAVECGIPGFRGLARAIMADWLYDAFVRPAGKRGIVFVSVQTNVTLGGRALVYDGVLEDIAYGGERAIDYVELSAARRRLVALDPSVDGMPFDPASDAATTGGATTGGTAAGGATTGGAATGGAAATATAAVGAAVTTGSAGPLSARLAIPAASIVDVVFRPVPVLLGCPAPGRTRRISRFRRADRG